MPILANLDERRLQPEIMDQPGLDPGEHSAALRALERINRLSGSARILWPPIAALAREHPGRPLRILDVATGAGDVPIRLWKKACRSGVALEISGCDRSSLALVHAQRHAAQHHAPIKFFEWDALHGDFPGEPDVVVSSLFLHHLDEIQAVQFLKNMAAAANDMVLVNDLERGRLGFLLAYIGTRVLSLSAVAHTDGPRSVENAFTAAEALGLAERAGLAGASVTRRWPCRYLMSWQRDLSRNDHG
ncbi:MAG TPA: methyltransferase domain-containing protein [Gemmataceae bacterium]|jgi:2-polyprenyl-3-methyl-5-hydroxy-6-metoxy-1,4-benzoquinol methylase|nr:methyltransferase domain-containing protein [Gemmataceae bacterium]